MTNARWASSNCFVWTIHLWRGNVWGTTLELTMFRRTMGKSRRQSWEQSYELGYSTLSRHNSACIFICVHSHTCVLDHYIITNWSASRFVCPWHTYLPINPPACRPAYPSSHLCLPTFVHASIPTSMSCMVWVLTQQFWECMCYTTCEYLWDFVRNFRQGGQCTVLTNEIHEDRCRDIWGLVIQLLIVLAFCMR